MTLADGALVMWVIYDRPSDYPNHVVVRRRIRKGPEDYVDRHAFLFGTLDEARAQLPPGLVRFPREAGDDPVIVETWL